MRLETKRLLLRELNPEDVELEVSLWADPQVTCCLGGPRNEEKVRKILQQELVEPPQGPLGQWPVVQKASGEFVGDCGLMTKEIEGRQEVELVYILAENAWGKGYATEIGAALVRFAFEELQLKRVVSLIDVENLASKHVAQKLGMHLEATVMRPDGVERELWVHEPGEVAEGC
jgi:[ribosomal protein S5]-alanine N-acetyltransferase